MTIYAFNRRIEVTSTYHVRRRRKPGVMRRPARDVLVLWACFGGLLGLLVALGGVL